MAVLVAVLAWQVAPAGAASAQHNPRGRFLGVVKSAHAAERPTPQAQQQAQLAAGNLTYHSGPVMHSNHTHAIYWEPASFSTTPTYKSLINGYLGAVAADSGKHTNVYASDVQYTDTTGRAAYSSTFAGAIVVTDPYPSNGCSDAGRAVCLTDDQIQAEVDHVVAANSLPRGLGDMYLVMTPPGVGSCFDSGSTSCAYTDYCAYHGDFGTGAGETLYSNQPYAGDPGCDSDQHPNGDIADATINLISHEHNETITDPLGTGWWDRVGNENGDKCAWNFGNVLGSTANAQYNQLINAGHYYLQQEWSNASSGCVLTMSNLPPTASFTSTPGSPTTGQTVSFDGSGSTDSDGTVASYSWTFGDGSTATGAKPSHTYSTAGSYSVKLTVTDNDGSTANVAHSITVSDRPPTAAFTFSPGSPTTGQGVSFDGSGSSDPDGTVTGYSWDFGDGSTATGAKPAAHAYAAAGTYTVKLTVTDNNGTTASIGHNVTVSDRPPTAAFTFSPSSPDAGQSVAFDGSGSSDPDGTISSYSWDFGDGSSAGTGTKPSHAYAQDGTYTVTLTVTDNSGRTGQTSGTVTVGPDTPPSASFGFSPTSPTTAQSVSFDGTPSSDSDGTISSYSWDFGDGSPAGSGATPSHSYADAGTYKVVLTVTDNAGATNSTSHDVTVTQPSTTAPPGGGAPSGAPSTGGGGSAPVLGQAGGSALGALPSRARLLIPSQSLLLSSSRWTGVLVRCRPGRRCAGTLTLTAQIPGTRGRRVRTVALGHARFSLAADHGATIKLHLGSLAATLLHSHRRVRVHATAAITGAAVGGASVTRSVWLAPAPAKKHR